MKVIELLNKIINGEEVPKKIKYDNYIYEYDDDERNYTYFFVDHYWYLFDEEIIKISDNEVEIIEKEHKIPEKLENYKSDDDSFIGLRETINIMYDDTSRKINEIIDYLKENK